MAKKNEAETKTAEKVKETKEVKETKPKKRESRASRRRNAMKEIKKKADYIDVDIQSMYSGTCFYNDFRGVPLFNLKLGEIATVALKDLYEMASKHPGYFRDYDIMVVDVIDEEDKVGVEEVLMYLGIDNLYAELNDVGEDYLDILLEDEDYKEFERVINLNNEKLTKAIAGAMVQKVRDDEYDQRDKMRLMMEKIPYLRDTFMEAEEARYE